MPIRLIRERTAVTTQFRQIRRTCSRASRHERHVEKSASREFIHGDRLSRGVYLFKRHDRSTSVDRAVALALIHFAYTRMENGFSIFRVSRTPPTWPLSRSRTAFPAPSLSRLERVDTQAPRRRRAVKLIWGKHPPPLVPVSLRARKQVMNKIYISRRRLTARRDVTTLQFRKEPLHRLLV